MEKNVANSHDRGTATTSVNRLGVSASWLLDEAVADGGFGQDMPRLSGIGFHFGAQMAHVYPQVVAILDVRTPPHFAQYLAVRQHLAFVRRQEAQHAVFDRRQVHQISAFSHRAGVSVEVYIAELESRRQAGSAGLAAPARRSAYARQQFADAKRFCKVVIRARIERIRSE